MFLASFQVKVKLIFKDVLASYEPGLSDFSLSQVPIFKVSLIYQCQARINLRVKFQNKSS